MCVRVADLAKVRSRAVGRWVRSAIARQVGCGGTNRACGGTRSLVACLCVRKLERERERET